jgi:hypothetical protein
VERDGYADRYGIGFYEYASLLAAWDAIHGREIPSPLGVR